MLKQTVVGGALIIFAMTGSLLAQEPEPDRIPMPPVTRADTTRPSPALLTMIVTWLSMNFDLPATQDLPQVEVVEQMKMATLLYRGLVSDLQPRTTVEVRQTMPLNAGRDLLAIYDVRRKTIYLREGWTGAAPADLSVLVHEMVHHLQNVAGLRYACPEEREKLAFAAQEQWLALFGRTLADDLELDPFTVLVRTTCPF